MDDDIAVVGPEDLDRWSKKLRAICHKFEGKEGSSDVLDALYVAAQLMDEKSAELRGPSPKNQLVN